MNKQDLKKRVCDLIDARRETIISIAEEIWTHPEPAYMETHTSGIIKDFLRSLGLKVREQLAVTGCRADLHGGGNGPTIALLGELDAIILPDHPNSDPRSGAAHACGHHAQIAALAGAATALGEPDVLHELSGNIALLAVPAEEFQQIDHYRELLDNGRIRYCGGKAQLIYEGVFDDVDIAIMIHSGSTPSAPVSYNGFVMKKITFAGKAAHAGLEPHRGNNALSMARLAMDSIDLQRDTLRDEDTVRIHGIISNGGTAVNVVPGIAELNLQVRARTVNAIRTASDMVERCAMAAAMAFGGAVEIESLPGYLPLKGCPELNAVHETNLHLIDPDAELKVTGHRGSSTDMGDVSLIMPSLHAGSAGMHGEAHTVEAHIDDPEKGYVHPAKLLAMDAIELLYGDAESGRRIANIKPELSKAEYLDYMEQTAHRSHRDYTK